MHGVIMKFIDGYNVLYLQLLNYATVCEIQTRET